MRGPLLAALVLAGFAPATRGAESNRPAAARPALPAALPVIRVATFNASLNRPTQGALRRELAKPGSAQANAVAEIIQRVRPDVLLLQEFDYDARGAALAAFQSNYLARAQGDADAIGFRYTFIAESNTGQPSGFDLDNDGAVSGAQDALGFGEFPGQYGMALLSRYPLDTRHARTFRKFLWRDLPGAALPDDAATTAPADWYSARELGALPLSSKSLWDVPVRIGAFTLHVLASHPTPPGFDGAEERNRRRNHDEIRFWSDYLSGATYARDDRGRRGGLGGRHFILMGDQNADPADGTSIHAGIRALLAHPRVNASFAPASEGAAQASAAQGGANLDHGGDARLDTADFGDRSLGNLRVDYLLPARGLAICGGGVFWPRQEEPQAPLVWGDPAPSSDHRLVWLDITSDPALCPRDSDPKASGPRHPDH